MKLTCFFKGHKWKFPEVKDPIGTVRYELATCTRCGTKQRVLCWVDKADEL